MRATSPAFNAVLSIAGAVVTGEGGPLSHAAVLARELGIPAVVGAPGALDLPDGATIEVDPRLGSVRVHQRLTEVGANTLDARSLIGTGPERGASRWPSRRF